MTRDEILATATKYVTHDRNKSHGSPENTFGLIAIYWSAHLETNVSASDVAVMMTLLKLARLKSNQSNEDNWIDAAGYMACGGELATEDKQ